MTSVSWKLYVAEQIQRNVGLKHQLQIIFGETQGPSVAGSGVQSCLYSLHGFRIKRCRTSLLIRFSFRIINYGTNKSKASLTDGVVGPRAPIGPLPLSSPLIQTPRRPNGGSLTTPRSGRTSEPFFMQCPLLFPTQQSPAGVWRSPNRKHA